MIRATSTEVGIRSPPYGFATVLAFNVSYRIVHFYCRQGLSCVTLAPFCLLAETVNQRMIERHSDNILRYRRTASLKEYPC
jgi:hypothetical protein